MLLKKYGAKTSNNELRLKEMQYEGCIPVIWKP